MNGKRRSASSTAGEDLISRLIHVEAGVVWRSAHRGEDRRNVSALLIAGHETTVALIGNWVLGAMLQHPRWWAALSAEPQQVSAIVEETLRYDPPVQLASRAAAEDMTIGASHCLREGLVHNRRLLFAAANRDPATFDWPEEFESRPGADARHLGFGKGLHFCLGAPLARLEAAVSRFVGRDNALPASDY